MIVEVPNYITKLWDTYRMPDNIRRHSVVVSSVASFFARELRSAGEEVDLELTRDGGLLHDIGKIVGIHEDREQDHHILGQEILEQEGYAELGQVVLAHMLSAIHDPEMWNSWEKKLVNFSDKIVVNDHVVGLKKRFAYLLKKYPTIISKLEPVEPDYTEFQNAVFKRIDIRELDYDAFQLPK